jgi:hypothetical protein
MATQEIEVRAGMLNATELILNAGVIDLTAVLASGGPRVKSPRWHVYEARPDPLRSAKRLAFGTESKQRFILPAGRYRVTVEAAGATATQEIEVQPGKLSETKIVLPR